MFSSKEDFVNLRELVIMSMTFLGLLMFPGVVLLRSCHAFLFFLEIFSFIEEYLVTRF